MASHKHPDYPQELERLEYTLNYVNSTFDRMIMEKERIDREVDRSKKGLGSDSSQEYIDLMINSMFQDSIKLKLRNLEAAKKKPYFARIDFKEYMKDDPEKVYIGKMSLMREEDQELVIVDWRAPVSNLYYEGRLGECSYQCPEGEIKGDLSLKRQFSIEDGKLKDIFDIDITTNDEFLQSYLGASADNRLKDIVTTIQTEQNQIIRADMWTPLIVQGAAGSGKTTIALHRIAYLIYTYERTFEPENFMIIAPTRFFLNYISDVLPELGVDRVKQTTFEDFAMEFIGKKVKLKDTYDKLTNFVNHNVKEEDIKINNLVKRESEFKSSMIFKDVLDKYIKIIEMDFIPKEDFKILSWVLFKYEEINKLFIEEYRDLPMTKRINEIKKHLNNRLKLKKDGIVASLQTECDRKIKHLKANMEEGEDRRKLIIEAIDYKNDMTTDLENISKKAVKEYISKISKLNPIDYYKEFYLNKNYFETLAEDFLSSSDIEFVGDYTNSIIKDGYFEIEDLAALMYIKFNIYGIDEKIPVKHIVIDEAQDFSVFQFYVLKNIIKDSSFTILGDLCQGIHSYRGTKDWENVTERVFTDGRSKILKLEQSYRTTIEIMDAANKVIGKLGDEKLPFGRPVIRHGEDVKIFKFEDLKEVAKGIQEKIEELYDEGFRSIAIVCKTMEECLKMQSFLKKGKHTPQLITGKEKEYKGGILIVPSYLAKGLEFDAVIIGNGNSEAYTEDELDIKLLYVSMTRPLHRLYIFYHGEISSLLSDI